jgi:hypothetical protein
MNARRCERWRKGRPTKVKNQKTSYLKIGENDNNESTNCESQ